MMLNSTHKKTDGTSHLFGVPEQRPDMSDDGKRLLRQAFGQYATGVTIVTARIDAGPAGTGAVGAGRPMDIGITANSFTSVSLDPPLVLWSIALTSQYRDRFVPGFRFAINVLSRSQEVLANHFGRSGDDQFAALPVDVRVERGLGDVPLLEGSLACFECVLETVVPAGDHNVLLARVERFFVKPDQPLTFHCGRYATLHPGT